MCHSRVGWIAREGARTLESDELNEQSDPFDGLVLDDDFAKGGTHEPPARTRDAIARLGGRQTSWRHSGPPRARPPRRSFRSRRSARKLHGVLGVSWIFIALVAAFVGSAFASWHNNSSRLAVFGFVIVGWLVSLCLHEFAHAAVAFIGGDRSVEVKGYLTLDIRRYANPYFSFLLPALFVLLGGIGLPGGAVWIEHASLRSRRWRSFTSLAGPLANVICAAACLAPFAVSNGTRLVIGPHLSFWAAVAFLGLLQLWAVLLNLLPIPGLDGWGAAEPYLPSNVVATGRKISPFAIMILFFVVVSSPAISGHLSQLLDSVERSFGVPGGLAGWGDHLMRFWSR
jgi:Zn-dependent protease